jgi:hypothetical protein
MTLICPYNNNTDQQDIETSVNNYSATIQQQAAIQQELNDAMNKLNTMQHDAGSDKSRPQDKDPLDRCFMYCCQVVFGLILDVSTAQQNVYANSEDVSSSVGSLTAHVQDLEAKGANAPDSSTDMNEQDGTDFFQASSDLQWDLNCTSYSYTDGTTVQGNYLQGAMDSDSRKQISDANTSIMSTYGISAGAFEGQTNTTFNTIDDPVKGSTGKQIAEKSNDLWTNTHSQTGTDTTDGQALDPAQTNMNDRFSTESTIANSTESTFNMRLQATITNTNTDMGTENEIQKMVIDQSNAYIKAQKGG